MAGTWEEYWDFGHTKKELYPSAIKHLRYGHDAILEDIKTGKAWTVTLKVKSKKLLKYKEPK